MYKKAKNPAIEELTKSYRDRQYSLGSLKVVKTPEGRFCVWCAEGKLNHGNQRYCSDSCRLNATAWAYPQKEESLGILLIRQGYLCASCGYDYKPIAAKINEQLASYDKIPDFLTTFTWVSIKRLKNHLHIYDKPHRLEVDHIIPIYKGGPSLGIDNVRAICYTCHKHKTSQDLKKEKK